MAVMKAINVKNSGRMEYLHTMRYVSNPEKNPMSDNRDRAEKMEMVTYVNRRLHGKEKSKRQFKQFVVSLASVWPKDESGREQLRKKLQSVMNSAEMYFMQDGFRASGWIHCNTNHPHFHLVLETCNAIDGKQFSQSKADLAEFKSFVSSQLMFYGLNEEILTNVKDITEEQLFEDEAADRINVYENESAFDNGEDICCDYDEYNDYDNYDDYTLRSREHFFSVVNKWNNGTLEHQRGIEMVRLVDNTQKREMVYMVDNTQKREMVCLIDNNQKREMFRVIDKEPKCEMVRLIHKNKPYDS